MRTLLMTEKEINNEIFKNVGVSTPRGFKDVFTDEEILALPNNENYPEFSSPFRDWIWSTIQGICEESK